MDWRVGIAVLAAAVLLYGCVFSQAVPAPAPIPQENGSVQNNTYAVEDGAGGMGNLDDLPPPPPE